jgi:hypothetical protein
MAIDHILIWAGAGLVVGIYAAVKEENSQSNDSENLKEVKAEENKTTASAQA